MPLPDRAVAFAPTRDNPICAIIRVVDGDTIEVVCRSGGRTNVRLVGFDTPETYRPGCRAENAMGLRAKSYLEGLLRGAEIVGIEAKGADRYDRMLAKVTINNRPLAALMINSGNAVGYHGGKRINWCRRLQAI